MKRYLLPLVRGWLLLGFGMSLFYPLRAVAAASDCYVRAETTSVNVRSRPFVEESNIIGVLLMGHTLDVLGRNSSGDWFAVVYPAEAGQDGKPAWVAKQVVTPYGDCDSLAIVPYEAMPPEVEALMAVPVLPVSLDAGLRDVFLRGQALGNSAHAFTKVGDCNTDTEYFLAGFDKNNYDLGPYHELEPTVRYFAGSFEHVSQAGQVGFNALFMLDPIWANPAYCERGESPLACEYRLQRPSVALMMFGPNDLINLTNEQFEDGLRQIVEMSLDQGVIPVLVTFTWHTDRMWQKALQFNLITVDIAGEYRVPLVNFWRAAQTLPGLGLMTDYTHLTDSNFTQNRFFISFNGEETFSGHALRNLLMLQVLDMLRREVLEPSG